MDQTNKRHPLVSVIVPVFNEKHFLKRCTDSIISQTYRNLEIVLVDDGSTDGSSKLCDIIQHNDKRIKVIHEENKGLSAARNTGVFHSHGNFVAFIDSDDFIDPDYIGKMVMSATRHNDIDLVITNFVTNIPGWRNPKPQTKRVMTNIQAISAAESSDSNLPYIVAWDKLYRRCLFEHVLFPEGKLHEDEFTYYLFFYYCRKILWINDSGYHYMYNSQSITRRQGESFNLDAFEALTNKCIFYAQHSEVGHNTISRAITNLNKYYLSMIYQNWKPKNIKQKLQYQLIDHQLTVYHQLFLSCLKPFEQLIYIITKRYPKWMANTYYFLKHLERTMRK